jgi:probable F420-dependent oxidoreductase
VTPLALSLPLDGLDTRSGLDLAARAEGWGYGACWLSEVQGPDAFTQLGALAVTTGLELGVAVVPVQTRTPMMLAMTAATLSELTGGRFALGIGSSSELIAGRWAGQPFDAPYTHVRETIEALRPMLAGEREGYDGRYVRTGGYRPTPRPAYPIPLLLGALGPRMLRLAGAVADGVCFNQLAPRHVPEMLAEIRRGAEEAGRSLPDNFAVVARLFCSVTDEPDRARDAVKRMFSPYVATAAYNAFYRRLGYEAEEPEVAEAAESRDREAMTEAMTDDLVDDLFVIGTADHVASKVRNYVEQGVTVPVISPLVADVEQAGQILRTVAERWG